MARGSLRLGAVAPRRFMGAVSTGGVDMNLGRTPERTAEREKLAAALEVAKVAAEEAEEAEKGVGLSASDARKAAEELVRLQVMTS